MGVRLKLKKNLVIPAGTVLESIEGETREFSNGNFGKTIGLTKNTAGLLTYNFDEGDPEINDWFEKIETKGVCMSNIELMRDSLKRTRGIDPSDIVMVDTKDWIRKIKAATDEQLVEIIENLQPITLVCFWENDDDIVVGIRRNDDLDEEEWDDEDPIKIDFELTVGKVLGNYHIVLGGSTTEALKELQTRVEEKMYELLKDL